MAKIKMDPIEKTWQDRKRVLGLPLTFTKYSLSDDRIFLEKGFLNIKSEEVLLYRIRDIDLKMNLGQRMTGVGTVCIYSSDASCPRLDIENVKNPREVKELIHKAVEAAKDKRRIRPMEVMGNNPFDDPDNEGDFDPDDMDNV